MLWCAVSVWDAMLCSEMVSSLLHRDWLWCGDGGVVISVGDGNNVLAFVVN